MDKEILLNAIEQIYAAACAQLERMPDQADRIASAYENSGADGVRIEMLRITNEQVLAVRSFVKEMRINPGAEDDATEVGSTGPKVREMPHAEPNP